MLSFLWSSVGESAADPRVEEGHRGLDVLIDGEVLRVDVDVLAQFSGLFLQVQATNEQECPLEDFPGGIRTFRQIVHLLMTPEEGPKLHVDEESVLNLFEAAWLLECPRVFDEVMQSPYLRSLSSRRQVELLEYLLPFTTASNMSEASPWQGASDDFNKEVVHSRSAMEEFMHIFLLETEMSQRTERAALALAKQLDVTDFVLGPRLATGSLRTCCEFLRLHQRRRQDVGLMSTALQPMSSMWKNLTDRPLRAKVSWDEHLFALQCIRKRLPAETMKSEQGLLSGEFGACLRAWGSFKSQREEDEEARADVPEELCSNADDRLLLGFAELVQYVDISRCPPNWAALLVRTLFLSGRIEEARKAFVESFPNSPRLRLLAWKPRLLPSMWLSDVACHVEASEVLLHVLSGYREMAAEEFCDIVEHVLLEHFHPSEHCSLIVLPHELINEMVGACFDAGEKVRAPQPGLKVYDEDLDNGDGEAHSSGQHRNGAFERRCPACWDGQHLLWRLAHLGTRLFEAAFVQQCGFLPHAWPHSSHEVEDLPVDGEARELPVRLEPLVVEVVGSCLWDEGLLRIPLLKPIMEVGCSEKALHFGQQVIMRHLWYQHDGSYCAVPRLQELWELARWPLCEDPYLLREALEYLKGTYRGLQAQGGAWDPAHEEALFRMFAALDLQRLPAQALLTPWVPAQVNMVRLLVQQQPAEQFHAELQQEVLTASESLKAIGTQFQKLHNRMNIVEQRTVINKSQINDAIVLIEEHQRKKGHQHSHPRSGGGALVH